VKRGNSLLSGLNTTYLIKQRSPSYSKPVSV